MRVIIESTGKFGRKKKNPDRDELNKLDELRSAHIAHVSLYRIIISHGLVTKSRIFCATGEFTCFALPTL